MASYCNRLRLLFLPAYYQHVGDLLHLRITDLCLHAVFALVNDNAHTSRLQVLSDLVSIGFIPISDGNNDRLLRGEPEWKGSSVMLNQQAEKSFGTPKERTMHHIGSMGLAILSDICQPEALWEIEIKLDGA